jgi:hypothetical protein
LWSDHIVSNTVTGTCIPAWLREHVSMPLHPRKLGVAARTILLPVLITFSLLGCSKPDPGPQGPAGPPGPEGPVGPPVLPVLAARKGFRGNKDLSAHKGLPVQEVRRGPQALRVQSDLKVRRAKQEPRARQVPQASAGRREYRAPPDLQGLLVLRDL